MVADVSDMVTVAAVRGVGSRERAVAGSRVAPLACTHTPVFLPAALVAGVVEARGVADLGVVVGVVAAAEAVQVVATTEAARVTRAVTVTVVAAATKAVAAATKAIAVMEAEAEVGVEAVEVGVEVEVTVVMSSVVVMGSVRATAAAVVVAAAVARVVVRVRVAAAVVVVAVVATAAHTPGSRSMPRQRSTSPVLRNFQSNNLWNRHTSRSVRNKPVGTTYAAQRYWLCPASRSTARVVVARVAAVVGWVAPSAAVVGRAVAVARVGWVAWVDLAAVWVVGRSCTSRRAAPQWSRSTIPPHYTTYAPRAARSRPRVCRIACIPTSTVAQAVEVVGRVEVAAGRVGVGVVVRGRI